MNYLKICHQHFVYYIRVAHVRHAVARTSHLHHGLLQMSDYVIDKRTNEIIKSRQLLESVLDKILEV